jgi:DNA polymerase III epsilon subunit-like protein
LHPSSDTTGGLAMRAAFTVLDFETTGSVPGWPVEPWQIGLVGIAGGRLQPAPYESLLRIDPGRPFNRHAPGRHARLRAALADAPSLGDLWPFLAADWLLNRPLVAHNIGTERSLLQRAAPLHRLGPWIDTLRLVRRTYPRLASAALDDVVGELGLEQALQAACPGRVPHDALYDATACALLLLHCLALPGWERVTVQALVDLD